MERNKMERNNLGKINVELEVIECKGISAKTGKPYEFYDYRIITPKMPVSVGARSMAEGILLKDFIDGKLFDKKIGE